MAPTLRVMTVCTHNRTRSVLMAGLLGHHAAEAGLDVEIISTGFVEAGLPPTDRTVRLLKRAGIDMSTHRSSRVDSEAPPATDLILTAERAHVVSLASRWASLFDITFTLPEAVERGDEIGARGDRDRRGWITDLSGGRPSRLTYLDDRRVGQVADPTGRSPAEWKRAFSVIDELTNRLVALLA
jgi:protein-tyrosine phosphatase